MSDALGRDALRDAPGKPGKVVLSYRRVLGPPVRVFALDGAASVTQEKLTDFPSQALSLMLWVKSVQTDSQAVLLAYGPREDAAGSGLRLFNPANLSLSLGQAAPLATGVRLNEGCWHHLALSLRASGQGLYQLQLYLDGALRYQSPGQLRAPVGLAPEGRLILGQALPGTPGATGFAGELSEFQLWRGGLNPAVIATEMQRRGPAQSELLLHWLLDAPENAGRISGGRFGLPEPALRFREPGYTEPVGDARLSWEAVSGATSYAVQVAALDGSWAFEQAGLSTTHCAIPGLLLQRGYRGRVRACRDAETSDWSESNLLTAFDLAPPQAGFVWPAGGKLSARWDEVAQAMGYRGELKNLLDGSREPLPDLPAEQRSYELEARADDDKPWALLVSATALGSQGPPNDAGSADPPTHVVASYEAADTQFVLSWSAGPASALMLVWIRLKDGGQTLVRQPVPAAGALPVRLPSARPLELGQIAAVSLRWLDRGTFGHWYRGEVAYLPRLSLAYAAAATPQPEQFSLRWNAPLPGLRYQLTLYRPGARERPVLGPLELSTPNFELDKRWLAPDETGYLVEVRAKLGEHLGPPSEIVTPPAPEARLAYYYAGEPDPGYLSVDWTPGPGFEVYLRLLKGDAAEPFDYGLLPGTAASYRVRHPEAFSENTRYRLWLRGLAPGTLARLEQQSLILHKLPRASLSFAIDPADSPRLKALAALPSGPPGLQYQFCLDEVVRPVQPGAELILAAQLEEAAVLRVQARGVADGSFGPLSPVQPPAPLAPLLIYARESETEQSLRLDWARATLVYLRIARSESPLPPRLLQAGSFGFPAAAFAEGALYQIQARPIESGQLGAFEPAEVAIARLSAPTNLRFRAGADLTNLFLDWDPVPQANGYIFKSAAGEQTLTTPSSPNLADLLPQAAPLLKLRGVKTGATSRCYGLWTDPAAPAAPEFQSSSYDAVQESLSLKWKPVAGAEYYYLELWDGNTRLWQSLGQGQEASWGTRGLDLKIGATRQLSLKLRALSKGGFSALATRTLTLKKAVGLVVIKTEQDKAARVLKVTLSGSGVSYQARLELADGTEVSTQSGTTQPVRFENLQIGTRYQIKARQLLKDHQLGEENWSVWGPAVEVNFGSSLEPVKNFSINSDTAGNLDAKWSPVPGDGISYGIEFRDPEGALAFSKPGIQGTVLKLPISETQLSRGKVYFVGLRAHKGGESGDLVTQMIEVGKPVIPPEPDPVGDPFNPADGSFSYYNVDLEVPACVPLVFASCYDSRTPLSETRPLGSRWSHSYFPRLKSAFPYVRIEIPGGKGYTFLTPPWLVGEYFSRNTPDGASLYVSFDLLAWKFSYRLTRGDQSVYIFGHDGELEKIISPEGNEVALAYQNGWLKTVTDKGSGRSLSLDYEQGRVKAVSDGTRAVFYSYNAQGLLERFTDVEGRTRNFSYAADGDKRLVKITDAQGQPEENAFLTNVYDDKGRITAQTDGCGHTLRVSYEEGRERGRRALLTRITDRGGIKATYACDPEQQVILAETVYLAEGRIRRMSRGYSAWGLLEEEVLYEGSEAGAFRGEVPVGNRYGYSYDSRGNLLSVTDPLGQVSSCDYNERNQLTRQKDPFGNITRYDYDGNLLTRLTDALGQTESLSYKAGAIKGLVEGYTDALGNLTRLEYDAQGNLSRIRDPLGQVTVFGSDGLGRVNAVEVLDSGGRRLKLTRLELSPGGRPKRQIELYDEQPEAKAFVSSYAFNSGDRLKAYTSPTGSTTEFGYTANDLLERIRYANGEQTRLSYDPNDQLQEIDYTPGVTSVLKQVRNRWRHDGIGRVTAFVDGLRPAERPDYQNTTQISYGLDLNAPAGPPERPWYPLQQARTLPPPDPAQPDKDRYTTQDRYDPLGRLLQRQTPAGGIFTLSYAPKPATPGVNLQVLLTLPKTDAGQAEPYRKRFEFDPLGRIVAETPIIEAQEPGQIWTTSYGRGDVPGHLAVKTVDPLGHAVTRHYDPLGRPVREVQGKDGGRTRSLSYAYDALSRLTRIEEAAAGGPIVTEYAYAYRLDADDRPCLQVSVKRAGRLQTVLEYNGAGQLLRQADPAGREVRWSYNARGQLASYRNARGQTLGYAYDPAGRLTSLTLPEGTISYELDGNGNRIETKFNGQSALLCSFDFINRRLSRRNARGETISLRYNAYQTVATLSYPDQKQVSYSYDGLRRLVGVKDWQQRETRYAYYPSGQLRQETLPNQVSHAYELDAAGRLTGFRASVKDQLLACSVFVLDPLGQPESITELLPLAPDYTGLNRSFGYDPQAAPDRLVSVDAQPVSDDADGNLSTLPGSHAELGHDSLNRLTRAGERASYGYDAEGLRETVTLAGKTRRYLHDPAGYLAPALNRGDPLRATPNPLPDPFWAERPRFDEELMSGPPGPLTGAREPALDRVLCAFDEADRVERRYVHGLGLIGSEDAEGRFTTHLYDSRGSTLALVDEAQALAARYAYTPYGAVCAQEGEVFNPFRYCGRDGVMDDGNGLLFMRARSYAPELMRFIEPDYLFGDPGQPLSLNRYAYVGGDPLRFTDPRGLSRGLWIGLGLAALGLGALVIVGGLIALAVLGYMAIGTGAAGLGGGAAGAIGGGLIGLGLGILAGGLMLGVAGAVVLGVAGGLAGGIGGGAAGAKVGPSVHDWAKLKGQGYSKLNSSPNSSPNTSPNTSPRNSIELQDIPFQRMPISGSSGASGSNGSSLFSWLRAFLSPPKLKID